ncbi:hypothetical protein F8154_05665, partial [Alkaliphilus pronyensis]
MEKNIINERKLNQNRSLRIFVWGSVKIFSVAFVSLSFAVYTMKLPETAAYFVQNINDIETTILTVTDEIRKIEGSINFNAFDDVDEVMELEVNTFSTLSLNTIDLDQTDDLSNLVGYIQLPNDYSFVDINLKSIQLKYDNVPINIVDIKQENGQLTVELNKEYLLDLLGHGEYKVAVEGVSKNGLYNISAAGILKVVDNEFLLLQSNLEELKEKIISGFAELENQENITKEKIDHLESLINEYEELSGEINEEWLLLINEIKEKYSTYIAEAEELVSAASLALEEARNVLTEEAIKYAQALIEELPDGDEKEVLLAKIGEVIEEYSQRVIEVVPEEEETENPEDLEGGEEVPEVKKEDEEVEEGEEGQEDEEDEEIEEGQEEEEDEEIEEGQ